MLSVFPDFLTFALFAPLLVRLGLGIAFITLGARAFSTDRGALVTAYKQMPFLFGPIPVWVSVVAVIEVLAGLSVLLGLYTQIGAIVLAAFSFKSIIWKSLGRHIGTESILFYFVTLLASLSLILSGAGLLAFDLPF